MTEAEDETEPIYRLEEFLFLQPHYVRLESRNKPICNVPIMSSGNQPIDGGYYLFSEEEMNSFLSKEPKAISYFHQWIGADEFLRNKKRYILYLDDCPKDILYTMPECLKIVKAVREYRQKSTRAATLRLSDYPTKFQVTNMPTSRYYIALPEVSAGSRRYIPMSILDNSIICSNKMRIVPDADYYHFGVLFSNVHMSWVRTVGGYYGPSYQYSVTVIYNNFPWPDPTDEQKANIEKTAKQLLDVRSKLSSIPLEKLYEPGLMPAELINAHQANDRAVWEAYGKMWDISSESDCVAYLMKLYQTLTEEK